MALNWDVTGCRNPEQLTDVSGNAWATTQHMVFATMSVGIGHIADEATALEFWVRMQLLRKLYNAPNVPLQIVLRYVGLRTNVAKETWAQFTKRHLSGFRQDKGRDGQAELRAIHGKPDGCDPAGNTSREEDPYGETLRQSVLNQ